MRQRHSVTQLHVVWDTLLLKQAMNGQRAADYADALGKQISDKQRTAWLKGTSDLWANESHQVAGQKCYAGIAVNAVLRLDEQYLSANERVVAEQLQRAGIRLAGTLSRAFAGQ